MTFAVAVSLLAAGCARRPDVQFAPGGKPYATKMDLARVERDHPLTPAQRAALTPRSLRTLSQEELDQLYARLSAGPIPDGAYRGDILISAGGGLDRLPEILGAEGLAADLGLAKFRRAAKLLWKGKVFYRDKMELRNIIEHRRAVARILKADTRTMRTGTVNGRQVGLLFPAKLYCGQSLLDSRRESVIIDYAFGDELDGYNPAVDDLGGRNGLQIRDEIRMIRPGFYLGRAYLGKIFLLNFTLYNDGVARSGLAGFAGTGHTEEDCWPGSQQVRMAGR
jgi:hypothetical protein